MSGPDDRSATANASPKEFAHGLATVIGRAVQVILAGVGLVTIVLLIVLFATGRVRVATIFGTDVIVIRL